MRRRLLLLCPIYYCLICSVLLTIASSQPQPSDAPSKNQPAEEQRGGDIEEEQAAEAGQSRPTASFDDYFLEHSSKDSTLKYLEEEQQEEEGEEGEEEHVHGFIKNGTAEDGPENGAQINATIRQQLLATTGQVDSSTTTSTEQPDQQQKDTQQLCPASVEVPTFLRHQWLANNGQPGMAAANFVRKMDSLEACGRLCRENVEPFGGRHFGCHGFTYSAKKNAKQNICEFFDDHLAAAIEKKPPVGVVGRTAMETQSSSKNYFERICLPLYSRCSRFPFAFEVHPRRTFADIQPIKAEEVDDRRRCLEMCLQNEQCRSVDFDTANGTCRLFEHTQHWTLGADLDKSSVAPLVESVEVDHYENTCLLNLDRCGSRHLAFVLVRNSELAGFFVSLGKLAISACLAHCLDSPPAFCRSVQFRPATEECFLGTERPLAPIPSDEMDIFEPICLPDPPTTSTLECLDEAVFVRIPNMELRMDQQTVTAGQSEDVEELSLEECLDACILEDNCASFNYRFADEETGANTIAQCQLLAFNRTDNRTLPVLIQNVDHYELACTRIIYNNNGPTNKTEQHQLTPTKKNGGKKQKGKMEKKLVTTTTTHVEATTTPEQSQRTTAATTPSKEQQQSTESSSLSTVKQEAFQLDQLTTIISSTLIPSTPATSTNNNCSSNRTSLLLDGGTTLRMEYRQQHHVNVRNLEQCHRTCVQAKALNCVTFAYSQKSRDCLLSSTVVVNKPKSEYSLIIQRNANFDLYVVMETAADIGGCPTAVKGSEVTVATAKSMTSVKTTSIVPNNSEEEQRTELTTAESAKTDGNVENGSAEVFSSPEASSPSEHVPKETTTTAPIVTTTTTIVVTSSAPPDTDTTSPPPPFHPLDAAETTTTMENREEGMLSHQKPLPLSPHQVHASALCDGHGMNVTFSIVDGSRYTGVVYAADRFSQCRLFVDDEAEFHFYVTKPEDHRQNWCNVHMDILNGKMAVMLVLSNDVGVPLEVTTKDDLFFHISCAFGGGQPSSKGVVVSGLGTPAEDQQEKRRGGGSGDKQVKLKILRDGVPVKNVYIGEHLTAVIESNDLMSAAHFRVSECNATAVPIHQPSLLVAVPVPGKMPPSSTIPLVDRRGCPLLPQIMGPWRWEDAHLEASLTAFRIAGSAEVDIVCAVIICRAPCFQQPAELCDGNSVNVMRLGRRMTFQGGIAVPAATEEGPLDQQQKVTVDQRIRVFVLKDEEAEEKLGMESGGKSGEQKKRIDLENLVFDEQKQQDHPPELEVANFGESFKHSVGDICFNPLVLLLLSVLLLMAIAVLFVFLVCRRKSARTSNFYPTSTELSSHHFHIPRVLDHRAYMS